MIRTKVKIHLGDVYDEIGHVPVIPISIPEMQDIKKLASTIHAQGKVYTGEGWGWTVNYMPEVQEPIKYSKMTFRPAVFTIGVHPIWFVSFTWERGKAQEPAILVENENLVSACQTEVEMT